MRCLAVLVLLLSGCASTSDIDGSRSVAPDDLRIECRVQTYEGDDAAIGQPVEGRGGRYVVLPDGALHAAPQESRRLPRVRTLEHEQIEAIWALLGELQLTDPAMADVVMNPELIAVGPGESALVADLRFNGRHIQHRSIGPIDEPDAALAELVRVLGRLAWMDGVQAEPGRMPPTRYDFGPDPYARYRDAE